MSYSVADSVSPFDVDKFNLTPTDCQIEIIVKDVVFQRIPCHKRILRMSSVLNGALSLTTNATVSVRLQTYEEIQAFKDLVEFFQKDNLDHVEQTKEAMLSVMRMANQYGSYMCQMAVMEDPLMSGYHF